MFLDANAELDKIDPAVRHLPEVLGVRLGIYRGLGKWELMEAVAKKLTHYDPDNAQWWISWPLPHGEPIPSKPPEGFCCRRWNSVST
jgi:streptogramin lyase